MSVRIGKYKLGKVLISSESLVQRRALEMDPGGTPIRVVSLCGLRVGAETEATRRRLVETLREWQTHADLPHTAKIIEVLDHTEAPDVDAVVVSELTPGRPLAELIEPSVDGPLDPTLSLYVLSTLCETLSASHESDRPVARLGAFRADSVWIDRQATVTVHNTFLGLAHSLVPDEEEQPDDVVAIKVLLGQLTTGAGDASDLTTPAGSALAELIDLEPHEGEGAAAFATRFASTVQRMAGEHGASRSDPADGLPLTALGQIFDADDRPSNPPERSRPLEVDLSERRSDAGALADFAPETDPQAELTAPEGGPGWITAHPPRDSWSRYAIGSVAVIVLIGVGMVLANGVPAWSRSPAADSVAADGYLDLRNLEISPADAQLYLSISGSDEVVRLPAGVHELEIRADGHAPRTLTIDVSPGETVSMPGSVALMAETALTHGLLDLTELVTVPEDVTIMVDGEPFAAGATDVPAGTHTLSFARAGYVTETRDIVVEAGDTSTMDGPVVLSPAIRPGTINVEAPMAVEIFEDGTRLGVAPYSGRFAPGPHVLELRYDGLSTTLPYQVTPFETIHVMVQLTRVNSTPFSNVSVRYGDTRVAVGSTPGRLLVPMGATLVFTHPELGQREIIPEPGQDAVSVSFATP